MILPQMHTNSIFILAEKIQTSKLTQFREEFFIATSLIRRQYQNTHNIIVCWLLQLQRIPNKYFSVSKSNTSAIHWMVRTWHVMQRNVSKMHKFNEWHVAG